MHNQANHMPVVSGMETSETYLEEFFINAGFYDLLPLALEMADQMGYDQIEVIEAAGKVHEKYFQYPPTKNRTAWFRKVFVEKLPEARSDILNFAARLKPQTDT